MIGKKEAQTIEKKKKKGREIEWRRGTETKRETGFFCLFGYDGVGVPVYNGGSGYDGVGVGVYNGGSGYDGVGVGVYNGGSGYDGVGGCGFFSLFHTFTKVQFILSNAVI